MSESQQLFRNFERPQIGGLQPFTMIDFPHRIACVIFLQGCNLRCRYCHNPELIGKTSTSEHSWDQILSFLARRRGFLEGVVFSGGEPTFQETLCAAVEEVREMGFEIAVHTNGCFPAILKKLLSDGLLSYVALDIKSSWGHYTEVTGASVDANVQESVRILIDSGVEHEFRTTIHPALISEEWLIEIGDFLKELGAKRFVLQKCRQIKVLDPNLPPVGSEWINRFVVERFKKQFKEFVVRGDYKQFDALAA